LTLGRITFERHFRLTIKKTVIALRVPLDPNPAIDGEFLYSNGTPCARRGQLQIADEYGTPSYIY